MVINRVEFEAVADLPEWVEQQAANRDLPPRPSVRLGNQRKPARSRTGTQFGLLSLRRDLKLSSLARNWTCLPSG